MKAKNAKKTLLIACVSAFLCVVMLIGTTFAWFTDSVTSGKNIIKSGNLDIEMYWADAYDGANTVWNDTQAVNAQPVFDYDNWEPGYTMVRYIKVANQGSLAFKYLMNIYPTGVVGTLAQVIDVKYDIVTDNAAFVAPTADNKNGSLAEVGTLDKLIDTNQTVIGGVLLPEGETKTGFYSGEIVVCISLHMQESAGNEYQNQSVGDAFDIRLTATQYTYENDSFDNLYDALADYSIYATQSKKLSTGDDTVEFSLSHKGTVVATVSVPASAIADVNAPVTVSVDGINPAETIVVSSNTKSFAYDINVTNLKDNLADDQLVTVVLTAPNALPAVNLYHKGDLMNGAVYDEVSGTVTFKTDSFSPFAVSYEYYEAATIDELREYTAIDNAYIKLTANMDLNLDPNVEGNACDDGHKAVLTGVYEYYNGVNIKGTNVAIDLNGHTLAVQGGEKGAYTVGAVFLVQPNSSLNITDTKGNGTIMAKDPCYIVWAPYAQPSYCDIYGGIFKSHSYADSENLYSMIYAGEGGRINVYGGFFLYNNKPTDDKNTTNGAFNVMDNYIPEENPCITIHDGVMLINQYYRQSTGTDDATVKLADGCEIVPVTLGTAVAGYTDWYQVQCDKVRFESKIGASFVSSFGTGKQVTLGELFKKVDGAVINSATVEVTISSAGTGSTANGVYTANTTDWTKSTIKFTGLGDIKVTIKAYSQGTNTTAQFKIGNSSDDGAANPDEW